LVDERIRSLNCLKVRLVGEGGKANTDVFLNDALYMAQSRNLNLVCVAPHAIPPVCKMFDYKKFIFEQKKKERDISLQIRQSAIEMHTVRMDNINIGENDMLRLVRKAEEYLSEGDEVKVVFRLKGRIRYENGNQPEMMLKKFIALIKGEFSIKSESKRDSDENNPTGPKEVYVILASKVKKGKKNAENENKKSSEQTPAPN
jgi:translation initiation factor IF-3